MFASHYRSSCSSGLQYQGTKIDKKKSVRTEFVSSFPYKEQTQIVDWGHGVTTHTHDTAIDNKPTKDRKEEWCRGELGSARKARGEAGHESIGVKSDEDRKRVRKEPLI